MIKHKRKPQVHGGGGSLLSPWNIANIESNVVIRGEPTIGMAKKGTSPGSLSPIRVSSSTHLDSTLVAIQC